MLAALKVLAQNPQLWEPVKVVTGSFGTADPAPRDKIHTAWTIQTDSMGVEPIASTRYSIRIQPDARGRGRRPPLDSR